MVEVLVVLRRMMRSARETVILLHGFGVELEVAFARSEELSNKLAFGDVRRQGKEALDVFVQRFAATIGNRVCYVCDWARHERQNPGSSVCRSFGWELLEQGYLEVVEVLVEAR